MRARVKPIRAIRGQRNCRTVLLQIFSSPNLSRIARKSAQNTKAKMLVITLFSSMANLTMPLGVGRIVPEAAEAIIQWFFLGLQ